mgnify:CR=1 FL=1
MNGAIVTLMEGRQQYQGCSAVVGAMAVVAAAARQWQHNNQLKKGENNRGSKACSGSGSGSGDFCVLSSYRWPQIAFVLA